ncbi:phage tail assembly protein [Cupriavidus sp. HPC(L)]|uniref:tail assembly protein n=1 Tax=Cupriavidus sp. HPC(L) TaxID=1217418 RepID=UPI0002917061|nr:tail assembly protein [Cupriavidus sp. HPC(L)]ESH90799.1 phage tail assembly protein [Cupriavidus sp. HPC(L)]
MSEKIRTIRLYGYLGTRFGRIHRMAVASAAEAVRALSVMVPGFHAELVSSRDRGIRYAVFVGRQNLREDELVLPPGRDDIRIAPVLQGAKRAGLFQTILGAAIIAIAYFNPFGYLSGPMVTAAYGMGASMALGGIVQMLSPQARGLSAEDRPENRPSYAFNGPVNTSAQGNPAPLLYGRLTVGSAVVSAGIYAEDQA